MEIKLPGKTYAVILSNLIASAVFFLTGLLILALTFTGRLSVENMDEFTKIITDALGRANNIFGDNFFLNIIFILGLGVFLYWVSKKV